MTEQVLITIQSTQSTDGETETVETVYSGRYRSLPDADVILYEELFPDDAGHTVHRCKNKMKLDRQSVRLLKKGMITTEMYFQNGTRHRSTYQTPYGVFDMMIQTHGLHITRADEQIHVLMQYALELNGTHISDCTMNIHIQPVSAA